MTYANVILFNTYLCNGLLRLSSWHGRVHFHDTSLINFTTDGLS